MDRDLTNQAVNPGCCPECGGERCTCDAPLVCWCCLSVECGVRPVMLTARVTAVFTHRFPSGYTAAVCRAADINAKPCYIVVPVEKHNIAVPAVYGFNGIGIHTERLPEQLGHCAADDDAAHVRFAPRVGIVAAVEDLELEP